MPAFPPAKNFDLKSFLEEGFLLVRGMFDAREIKLINRVARTDNRIEQAATTRADSQGGKTVLAVQDHLSDDFFSTLVRQRRLVELAQSLLQEEVYHYHHKLMLKEPIVGGAWEWHQDYGYWYNYGCLSPRMLSCFIAIDPCTRDNGCLQIIPKSHHLGRLDHGKVGGQTGADPQRVNAILERFPKLFVRMDPGDALFFHANLLHRSDQNTSPNPRWSFITCYNAKSNSPYELLRHNAYKPLDVVAEGALLKFE